MKFNQYCNYETLAVGDVGVVIEETNILNRARWKRFIPGDAGIGGNLDSSIKRLHGWRGTTNDISREALGLREIIAISDEKLDRDGCNYVTITVGPDLAPDRE